MPWHSLILDKCYFIQVYFIRHYLAKKYYASPRSPFSKGEASFATFHSPFSKGEWVFGRRDSLLKRMNTFTLEGYLPFKMCGSLFKMANHSPEVWIVEKFEMKKFKSRVNEKRVYRKRMNRGWFTLLKGDSVFLRVNEKRGEWWVKEKIKLNCKFLNSLV